MALLLRFLAIPVLWLFINQQKARHSPVLQEIDHLSWKEKEDLTWRLARDSRVPLAVRPIALIPAAYMASPIDIVPDFLPFVGKIDDNFIFTTAYSVIGRFVPTSVLVEHIRAVTS
jgi:uncharacterized membrane protein YkvA (DUF1232 family)